MKRLVLVLMVSLSLCACGSNGGNPGATSSTGSTGTPSVAASPCGTGNEALLSGQYAFSLSGFNGAGFLAIVGAFNADGAGKIIGGEADTNSDAGSSTSTINPSDSSYSVGSDNRGCATLSTSFGTFTTRFVLSSVPGDADPQGRIIEFEPANSSAYLASGEMLLQRPDSFPGGVSGNFTFALTGWDFNTKQPTGTVGVMSAGGGQITSFENVENDGGTIFSTPANSITGSYSGFDTYGRTTVTFASNSGGAAAVFYMSSPSQLLYLQTSGSPVVTGEMQQQTVPPGGFTNGSASGNMVIYGNGASGESSGDSFIGVVNSKGNGTLTLSMYEDNGADNANNGTGWQSLQSPTAFTCSYSTSATGKVSLSGSDPHCAVAPVFYLSAPNAGTLLGQNPQMVQLGALEPQANLTFNNSTLTGDFFVGPLGVMSQGQQTEVDRMSLASGGGTFVSDITSTTAQHVDDSGSLSYTVNSDGTATTNAGGVPAVQMIVINGSRYVTINQLSDVYPYVLIGQQ